MSKIIGVTVGTPLSIDRIKREISPDIKKHEDKKDNPHGVTKDQVGLGNVDNTSDMNKPVSTAQATAIADAKKAGTDAQTAADNAQTAANNAQSTANEAKASAQTLSNNALETAKTYSDSKHKTFSATITASGWSSSAPYTQAVTVSGILAADTPHISPVYSDTLATALAQKESWEMVSRANAEANKITFICFEDKPTTDIPIQVEVNR